MLYSALHLVVTRVLNDSAIFLTTQQKIVSLTDDNPKEKPSFQRIVVYISLRDANQIRSSTKGSPCTPPSSQCKSRNIKMGLQKPVYRRRLSERMQARCCEICVKRTRLICLSSNTVPEQISKELSQFEVIRPLELS